MASRKGAPTIAPIATWSPPCSAPSRATIATSVSGIAVPTAGEDAAHGPLPQLQPVADPLDRVGEEQRPGEDYGEAGEQE